MTTKNATPVFQTEAEAGQATMLDAFVESLFVVGVTLSGASSEFRSLTM
jgi:hypothetical protein